MNLEIEETGPVERRLCIEIPTADVDAAFDDVFKQLGRGARVRGFRKGRVPRSVLEKVFSNEARNEVFQRVVQRSLPDAVAQGELSVLGDPRIEPGERPMPGLPFRYDVRVEIRPEIELVKLAGLDVKPEALEEPEQDPVERRLDELRNSQAQLLPVEDETGIARGHCAVIDYQATIDGEPFEGGSAKQMMVEVGEERTIPGFEDQLLGMCIGQERDFELPLPQNYPENLAGRTARFDVKLTELKRRELPELDDEFAKDVSDFDTLTELRADVRAQVDQARDAEIKRRQHEALIDALIEANPFPVPEGLVERQLQSRLARALMPFRGRLPDEQLQEMVARWSEQWRPLARRDVQLGLLIPEIAAAEQIEVSKDDVEERLRQMAEQQGVSLPKLEQEYPAGDLRSVLASGLLEERVLESLLARATLSGP